MSPEHKKRPRRVVFTPEEVANMIAVKKWRERIKRREFKASTRYKLQNIFNVLSFFIYWEIIFCFFGPADYVHHYSINVEARYSDKYNNSGQPAVSEMDFYAANGSMHTFIVDDFVSVPHKFCSFYVGRDFILRKNLKAYYQNSSRCFRLFAASPSILLILLTLIASTVAYIYNLNENQHSLMAVTVLNTLILIGLIAL